ncbi:ABC transporter [Phytophthora megakarya]|uniref:ABC transporter n=1 Tax=Phytophthora megakarya TaxID=4795 RepID=A0A225W050_9STRA|nr:ABC transporter [Phytophthora megakarya]
MMPSGGPSAPTTGTAATSAIASSSGSSLVSSSSSSSSLSSSSSSSSDGTALLTSCLSTIVTADYNYALCVMNSGFFQLDSTSFASVSAIAAASGSSAAASGSCTLMCTKPTLSASSSCCSAASTVLSCPQSSSSIDYCKAVIEDSVAESQECGLSAQNTALIVCVAIIGAFFVAVMVAARIHAKRQAAATADALESRFAIVGRAAWEKALAAWRQTTNLIWKNLVIRRRKPVSFVFELLLPVVLTLALVFIANLDTIFGTGDDYTSSSEAASNSETILCTGLESLEFTDYGQLSTNMSTFYSSGQSVIGLFLLISYIKFVSTTTTTMVIEKETRIREVMKIMGLSNFTLLTSWCLTTAILATPLAFIIAAELKFGQVFPMTEYATLVFLFWALSLSIVSFSYFITPFFNKSRAASIASVLLWLVLFFPFFSVMSKSNSQKYLGALAPPTAFALGIDDLVRRAQLGRGLAYAMGLVESPITVPSAFAMSWFLILDSFILVVLGWYFDNVLPQEFGVRKPWNFMFVKEYWLPLSTNNDKEVLVLESPSTASSPQTNYSFASPRGIRLLHQTSSDGSIVMMKDRPGLVASVEPVNAMLAEQERKGTCLEIRGLRKEFPSDDGDMKVAVQGLNLTLYAGQISALLGHNGAGKTTTISMLTGLIPPTSGDATLYGRSVQADFNELRQIMGICPQHDVLLNELTVEEHLLLFGTMKNIPFVNLKEEVERMVREVGLVEKRKVAARNLSGGQKRKLSVALAFMGDSKLVFLDEPTSGMDPYSRRFTWNLLQRNRDDRVIVLTTHFMDEADILGDRIAIMADGQLCCAGSSLFLKNRYGAGYNLTMIKAPGCDVEVVGTFLRKFVPEAKCLSNFGSEVVFQLPSKSSGVFSTMLQVLDDEKHHLRIVQYGVSVTTLEEVFLRISQDREEEAAIGVPDCGVEAVDQIRKTSATSANSRGTLTGPISSVKTNRATLWSQYAALLTKRVRIAKRDKKNLLNAVCIPLLFLIILVSLPEIDVASFMTTSDYATDSCDSYTFNYCDLGVIDCSASTCCDKTNVESPYYACNMCDGTSSSNPVTPCYNKSCLDKDGAKLQATLNAFLTSVVVMLAFAFVPAAIVAFIVREKNPNQNAKNLQLICGANMSAYWLSTWTHDIVIMMVTVIAAMIMVPLSDRTLTSSMEFKKHAVAQTSLLVFALCTGGLLSIFSFLCRLIDFDLTPGNSSDNLTLSSLDRNYLRWIFLLFPGYSLNNGIYEIATRKLKKQQHWPSNEDDDVAKERQKVKRSYPTQNDSVFIRNLRQEYGNGGKVALDNLCLSIPKGECFGYLGINGAGKSTTMKVLTGEIAPTNGFVTLGGYDLSRDRNKARRVVGYCPQFDSLHDLLTVVEQLELYARLKGIPSDRVQKAVDQKIEEVGLSEYRTKLTQGLSGGNKRKLSTAIALIGSPSIIFLDEPSTGVDPSSRRKMWDVIASDKIISLCSSLGVPNRAHEIMNGEGNGTVLNSYLETSGIIPIDVFCAWWHTENMGLALLEFFQSKFQGCQLVEHQGGHFRYQVPKQALRPHVIFGLLEENKEQLHVSEYGVSETSLEHIFNTMAAQQEEEQLLGSARYRGDW